MNCGLCGDRINPRHEEEAIRPGPTWPIVHVECFAALDSTDEAASLADTHAAWLLGESTMEET